MDRGTWRATVHGIAREWAQVSDHTTIIVKEIEAQRS